MPFGTRRGFLNPDDTNTLVEIDFDGVWMGMIKPALPDDMELKRADELQQPGLIDQLYNEWLYEADLVLADLTFGNPNVYYELGIRQALSGKGTVLVACRGTQLPFDVRNQTVLYYDYSAAPLLQRFQEDLRRAITNARSRATGSPVHIYLPELYVGRGENPSIRIEQLRRELQEARETIATHQAHESEKRFIWQLEEVSDKAHGLSLYGRIMRLPHHSLEILERLAIMLRKFGCYDQALDILLQAVDQYPNDPGLLRELGFIYRKKGPEYYDRAEKYMQCALALNNADVELHGMYGGLLKRRGEYGTALQHYRHAQEQAPDSLYAMVNLGAMNAAMGDHAAAEHWYREVMAMCERTIAGGTPDYWTYLCLAEALVAISSPDDASTALAKARDLGAPTDDIRSAAEQFHFFITIGYRATEAKSALRMLTDLGMHSVSISLPKSSS